MYRGMGRE
jgi:hypothetical protein